VDCGSLVSFSQAFEKKGPSDALGAGTSLPANRRVGCSRVRSSRPRVPFPLIYLDPGFHSCMTGMPEPTSAGWEPACAESAAVGGDSRWWTGGRD
jgi:hypothetical protein